MSRDILARAAELKANGQPFVLATVVASYPPQSVRPGAKAIIVAGDVADGWVGGGCIRPVILDEARDALARGTPRLVRMNAGDGRSDAHAGVRSYPMTCQGEGGVEIYLEPVLPAPRLVVLGETPVARALVRLGEEVGFDVATSLPIPEHASVVVATMGAGDEDALTAAAVSGAGYVGLVASRKKARFLTDFLSASGIPRERLARVKAPAGLDLGGMTPGEIALSILAEIVQRRHAADAARARPAEEQIDVGVAELLASSPTLSRRLPADARPALPVDPVCGMPVDPATAKHTLTSEAGETLYFCCPHCKARYAKAHA